MNLFVISIGVVLGLVFGNYFKTSIGYFLFYSVDLALVTLIGTIVKPLLGNYMGRSLEAFIGLTLYIYFSPPQAFFTLVFDIMSSSLLWKFHMGKS